VNDPSKESRYVITDPWSDKRPAKPTKHLPAWVPEDQMERVRAKIETHLDAGLHIVRHTFSTEAAEHTDPFYCNIYCNTWQDTNQDYDALCTATDECSRQVVRMAGEDALWSGQKRVHKRIWCELEPA